MMFFSAAYRYFSSIRSSSDFFVDIIYMIDLTKKVKSVGNGIGLEYNTNEVRFH